MSPIAQGVTTQCFVPFYGVQANCSESRGVRGEIQVAQACSSVNAHNQSIGMRTIKAWGVGDQRASRPTLCNFTFFPSFPLPVPSLAHFQTSSINVPPVPVPAKSSSSNNNGPVRSGYYPPSQRKMPRVNSKWQTKEPTEKIILFALVIFLHYRTLLLTHTVTLKRFFCGSIVNSNKPWSRSKKIKS